MSIVEMAMGMFRDEGLRKEGENRVAVKSANRLTKARSKAYDKIKTFDDAINAINSRLPDNDNSS